ncbi:S9 family peptidase [Microbacterium sp. NPDC055442]
MTTPYGSWPSPLTAAAVSAASPRIEGARLVGDDVWWGEGVPEEAGRTTVRRRTASGGVEDLLPAPWSARSSVHEYGGGSWTATDDGALVFVEKTDQRVRLLRPGGELLALTPPGDVDVRFGGLTVQSGRLLAVREAHGAGPTPARDIVEIPLDGSAGDDAAAIVSLAGGTDFVAHPALSPDGTHLAWVAWNHPDMPWDRAQLRVSALDGGAATVFDEGASPLQPVWLGDDELLYADDPTGRWNLYRRRLGTAPSPVAPVDADTGGGIWVLGTRWFAPVDGGRVVAVRTHGGDEVVVVDLADGTATPLGLPVSANASIEDVSGTRVLVSGADTVSGPALWLVDVDDPAGARVVRGGETAWGREWMPQPRAVTFDGPHGPVHAFDYPPTNPRATAPADELPPYVVFVHGGPTAHSGPAASGKVAYLTSRGIGVLDVNYGGSTGYGRAYRERLRGQWGVVDVDDVAAAAAGLAASGVADSARIAIAGGSAGGWTVLAAVTRTDAFSAGISRYGVGDARSLAADTHDFEARYLDGLIGPLPEAEDVYIERSPLSRPALFRVPLLLLQGADDRVVPPAQSEAVRDALAAHGVPHAYVLYEGEGHGFRKAETVVHALETELAFLGAVFGFTPPDVPPVTLATGD